jgi:uncharacterized tellurite resistance protein B-like protein
MADENTPLSTLAQLQKDIKESISTNANVQAVDVVKAALLKRVVDKNADTLIKGIDALEKMTKEGYRLSKTDINTIAADGSKAGVYSEAAWKALQEHTQKQDKLTAALNAALDKSDYSKLSDLVK